jgi:hypothetical protein
MLRDLFTLILLYKITVTGFDFFAHFVLTKIVLKVVFLEHDFERDLWRKKATGQKWAEKYNVCNGQTNLSIAIWQYRKLVVKLIT